MITGELIALSMGVREIRYFGLFVLLLLGYIPVIGGFLPDGLVLIIAGFLAKVDSLSLICIIIIGFIAIILGDIISYYLGKHMGAKFLEKYNKYFLIKKEHTERLGRVINNHTAKAVILGKFNPFTRPVIPFVIASHRIAFKKFLFYEIIGSFIWVCICIFLGYFFGHSYKNLEHLSAGLIWIATLVIIGYFSYCILRKYLIKFRSN